MLPALTVLIGCRSTGEQIPSNSQIIKNMVPDLPVLPAWPKLSWILEENGRYSVDETDVDKILDYWENQIPAYLHEMEIYQETLNIILGHL